MGNLGPLQRERELQNRVPGVTARRPGAYNISVGSKRSGQG